MPVDVLAVMSRHVSPSTVSASAIGFVGGPLLALVVYGLLPEQYVTAEGATVELTHAGSVSAAVGVWMAVWWLTEAIEIPVTALLPLALFPVLGARSMREAAAPYANELIFLFMGGFIVSLSMQRWGLHRRIALSTLTVVGTNPSRIVAGFMATTAGLSMWLSNSATTMMMLPIAVSVIRMMSDTDEPVTPPARAGAARRNLSVCLMLGIAYAASIGGVGTIIGSPPNLFLVSYMRDTLGREISFTRWLAMGLPLVGLFVPVAWYLLTHVLYPLEAAAGRGGDAIGRARAELGPMCWGERVTAVVFGATAAAWIGRTLLVDLEIAGVRPLAGLTDPGIAMLAATSLFLVPARTRERDFVMNWEHAKQLPWGILILFGGGLSLAAAIQDTGVGAFIGHQAAAWPSPLGAPGARDDAGDLRNGTDQQHRDRGNLRTDLRRVGLWTRRASLLADRAGGARSELGVHAARRHAAERRGLWIGICDVGGDAARRLVVEPHRHRAAHAVRLRRGASAPWRPRLSQRISAGMEV